MLFYTYILTLNHPKWYKSVKSGHNQAKTDPDLALSDLLDEIKVVSECSILCPSVGGAIMARMTENSLAFLQG